LIALISDTHMPRGARRLPDRCVDVLREAALIVHAGDFTGAAVLAELETLAPVVGVHGNMDDAQLRGQLPERLDVEEEGVRIGVVHDGGPAVGRHERLRSWFPEADVIVYGHSHIPEVAANDGAWIVNPGSPTERRRAPTRTMAVIEAGAPRLVDLGT
jgi:putative phosphoesterase